MIKSMGNHTFIGNTRFLANKYSKNIQSMFKIKLVRIIIKELFLNFSSDTGYTFGTNSVKF